MTKFKVGDRVRQIKEVEDKIYPGHGTVIARDGSEIFPVLVEFDAPDPEMHDGGGEGKNRHCWWVGDKDIELIPNLKIEAGRYYRTRDGRKVGPVYWDEEISNFYDNRCVWKADGTHGNEYVANRPSDDLIAEWTDEPASDGDAAAKAWVKLGAPHGFVQEIPEPGPVRTIVRKEIVPGTYGIVDLREGGGNPFILLTKARPRISELRAAAETLIQIADALEDEG